MDSDRELPKDGSLPSMESPSQNPFTDNVMLVKIPEKFRKPGDLIYDFATLDRTLPSLRWPADDYIDSLIPGLQKVEVICTPDETASEGSVSEESASEESEKEIVKDEANSPLKKPVFKQSSYYRQPRFRGPHRSNYHGFRKTNATHRKKTWNDQSQSYRECAPSERHRERITTEPYHQRGPTQRLLPNANIKIWDHEPWENQPVFSTVNKLPVEGPSLNTYPRQIIDQVFFQPPLIPAPLRNLKSGLLGDAPNTKFDSLNQAQIMESFEDNFRHEMFSREDDRSSNAKFESLNRPIPNADNFGHEKIYNYLRDEIPNIAYKNSNRPLQGTEGYDDFRPEGSCSFPRDERQPNTSPYESFIHREVGTEDSFNTYIPNAKGNPATHSNGFHKRRHHVRKRSFNNRGARGKHNGYWNNNEKPGFLSDEPSARKNASVSNLVANYRPHQQSRPWDRKARNSVGRARKTRRHRVRQSFQASDNQSW